MDVLLTVLLFVPFIFILWLANLAWRKEVEGQAETAKTLRWVAYGLLLAWYLLILGVGLLLQLVGAVLPAAGGPDQAFSPVLGADRIPAFALGLWAPSLLGILLLWRPVRRLFGRFTDLDPDNPVHAVALSYVGLVLLNLFATLGMGLDSLAVSLEQQAAMGMKFNPTPTVWAQELTWFVMALVGIGWLSRRSFRSALERLAIVRPRLKHLAIGVGVGFLMAPLVIAAEYGLAQIGVKANADVERLAEQLIGPLALSIPGILTLGLAAALGEESLLRGAMQPRFGLIFTTVIFALLHSTYGISLATAIVFAVGLVLGLLRKRYNTTTSMTAHAVYNMTLGLIALLGLVK
jgi:uncharacterized protein